ncbi:phage portal protein [Paenibacillus albiflavus]|uniref:Phage portal protein n=2 Tax=Paenibacillus albiflavus TaxID=2545760 RepID=A0A4R4EB87_9BACL|nr:phage portal protein [Paenibacillus albiflavus]
MGGSNTQSGEVVTANTAPLNSNVYTCASILGGDIGKLPIQLYRRKKNGLERDESHPVAELLGWQPNQYMTAYTYKETVEMHLVTWGNSYSYIEWGPDGRPVSLFPLHPALTDIRFDLTNGSIWYVTTFPFPGGETRKIPASDILHFKAIGTSGLKGITPIAVIREKLGIQQSSDKFLGAFYSNGTATSGVLKVPTPLDKPAKDKAREEWQKLHTGLSNAHKIAILDAGMEYQALGMPLADAQFIETQKFGISEVAKIYKIPPHKLGLLDKATFSNIEHQSLEYVKNTLTPIFVNWEQEIRRKLFTPLERKRYYTKFDVTSELRGDSKSLAEYYKLMIEMGVYTINEVRAFLEADNIGNNGDKHLISLNYTTLDNLEKYQLAKAGLGGKGGGGSDGEGTQITEQ